MYFYLHLRCTTLMFSFLYSCVGVLPWPPPISCFLKWCSVSYVPVSSLTLAVTFLLISSMMLSFLGPCLTLAATTLFIYFYNDVRFFLSLCQVLPWLSPLSWRFLHTEWSIRCHQSPSLFFLVSSSSVDLLPTKFCGPLLRLETALDVQTNMNYQIRVVFLSTVKLCSANFFEYDLPFYGMFSAFKHV